MRSAELKNHNSYNLVSHSEQQEQGRMMWFLLAASCYVRVLQVTGYFPVIKTKVPGELDQDEKMIGGLMVELIQRMQFNTHAITEASDFLPAKYGTIGGVRRTCGRRSIRRCAIFRRTMSIFT